MELTESKYYMLFACSGWRVADWQASGEWGARRLRVVNRPFMRSRGVRRPRRSIDVDRGHSGSGLLSRPVTTLDCAVLGDLFGSEEVREVFDSSALVQAWLDVEQALARAEAEVGVIPVAAADRIEQEARAELYELDELRTRVTETQHPLVPLVRALAERCGEAGGFVHWGATTQDVLDTALVLQVRAALGPIRRDLRRSTSAAAALALKHRSLPMAGRTHGQHAVPITFGLKAASWADELMRCEQRLEAAAAASPLRNSVAPPARSPRSGTTPLPCAPPSAGCSGSRGSRRALARRP